MSSGYAFKLLLDLGVSYVLLLKTKLETEHFRIGFGKVFVIWVTKLGNTVQGQLKELISPDHIFIIPVANKQACLMGMRGSGQHNFFSWPVESGKPITPQELKLLSALNFWWSLLTKDLTQSRVFPRNDRCTNAVTTGGAGHNVGLQVCMYLIHQLNTSKKGKILKM